MQALAQALPNEKKMMKMKKIFTLFIALATVGFASAQTMDEANSKLPSIDLKTLDGETVNTSTFSNDGNPIVVSFWATWCAPCKKELSTIHELYPDWQDETGVKLIAISIDNTRSSSRVKPYVDTEGWEYECFLDENSDFFRAMNGVTPPLTFLMDGEGNIVYTHNGYSSGDEDELYEKILELVEE